MDNSSCPYTVQQVASGVSITREMPIVSQITFDFW